VNGEGKEGKGEGEGEGERRSATPRCGQFPPSYRPALVSERFEQRP